MYVLDKSDFLLIEKALTFKNLIKFTPMDFNRTISGYFLIWSHYIFDFKQVFSSTNMKDLKDWFIPFVIRSIVNEVKSY